MPRSPTSPNSASAWLSNKYPFARDSAGNAQIGEFAQLFGPNGMMDKFFADYLSPITDMSGQAWDWQKDTRLGRELSVDTLRQFQRAAEIRSAFFPDGGPTPNVQLTIAPHTISRDADMALLEVNQVVLQTSLAGNAPVSLRLAGQRRIGNRQHQPLPRIARPRIAHRQGRAVGADAADRCRLGVKKGEELIARFVIGGREVSYQIRIGSSYNPLFLPALKLQMSDGF